MNLTPNSDTAGGRWKLDNLTRSARDVLKVFRAAAGYQIVHLHSAMAPGSTVVRAAFLCLAARLRGSAVLLHVHGGRLPSWATGAAQRILLRASVRTAHHVATVSRDTYEVVAGVQGSERTSLVRNGVDTSLYSPARQGAGAPQRPVVLYVGHLSPRKGLGDLLEASRSMRAQGIDHEVWCVGGRPDEGAREAVRIDPARDIGWRLVGPVDPSSMPELYQRADVFCLPSWWEAMPLTVLEAMASGLAVVATDVGDVPTAVRDGETGLLVPPKSPSRLSAALAQVLSSPDAREAMGRRGRAVAVQHWSAEATWTQLHSSYQIGFRRRRR